MASSAAAPGADSFAIGTPVLYLTGLSTPYIPATNSKAGVFGKKIAQYGVIAGEIVKGYPGLSSDYDTIPIFIRNTGNKLQIITKTLGVLKSYGEHVEIDNKESIMEDYRTWEENGKIVTQTIAVPGQRFGGSSSVEQSYSGSGEAEVLLPDDSAVASGAAAGGAGKMSKPKKGGRRNRNRNRSRRSTRQRSKSSRSTRGRR